MRVVPGKSREVGERFLRLFQLVRVVKVVSDYSHVFEIEGGRLVGTLDMNGWTLVSVRDRHLVVDIRVEARQISHYQISLENGLHYLRCD